jgi:quercetin dioxygenase-like cupin family protein
MMRTILVLTALLAGAPHTPASAFDNTQAKVVVTPLAATTTTATGQPIALPQKDAQVIVSMFDIPPGAALPVHQHPFPRYGYVLAGTLQVTRIETGEVQTYKTGDFIVEMIGQWHQGANPGPDAVKLLVIDQVEEGAQNTILRK